MKVMAELYKKIIGICFLVFFVIVQSIIVNAAENVQSFSHKRELLGLIRENPGKVVVLSMVASWCAVCKSEVKELNRLQAFYKDRVVVYGLSLDKEKEKALEFKKETGAMYPVIHIAEKIGLDFRVSAIPHLFFYDPNGILYMDSVGLKDMEALKEIVEAGLSSDEHAGHNHD